MRTFLEETLEHLLSKHGSVSSLILVCPSKRSGGFLKHTLGKIVKKTDFSPRIISIEEFIEEISGLKIIDNSELLLKSYEAYVRSSRDGDTDSFEVFSTWAPTLLNDINEIDRYLVPPKHFFDYLSSIQDMNHWYLNDQKTPLIKQYLKFWNGLYDFYVTLKDSLLESSQGYQGLVYRKAAEDIEHYMNANPESKHVFIGFNALNLSEQTIVQELLETGNSEIYWDIDNHLYGEENHSASFFIRKYCSEWNYYNARDPEFIRNNFSGEKRFQFVESPSEIGQVKYIGEALSRLSEDELDNTAIVLGDEQLLVPLLHSIPENVKEFNVTMGLALRSSPLVTFFDSLVLLHKKNSSSYYYKEVISLLNHPSVSFLLKNPDAITSTINRENISYVTLSKLMKISYEEDAERVRLLFENWNGDGRIAVSNCLKLIALLKGSIDRSALEYSVVFELYNIFHKIELLYDTYGFLNTIQDVHHLFSELVTGSSLDIIGEAYRGLQIMGVLETRALDFKNVFVSSVNEGILPSGKSNASFITYDLKKQFGLPLYTEKDAIYTYHFYRLLHRAKTVTFMYSNISEGLNTGEKSRFITQLLVNKMARHEHEQVLIAPSIPKKGGLTRTIHKSGLVLDRIRELAEIGFSPSSLTSYMRDPMEFYLKKILGIDDYEEVEETVAANTLGTIVHDSLESFYKPLEKRLLSIDLLREMKKGIHVEVSKQFEKTYRQGDYTKGKNLIIFEVAKRYISNFIDLELRELSQGHEIEIIRVESKLKTELLIPELNFPVYIQGKVDRLDRYNGQLRIIDYKTGSVKQGDVEIINWDDLTNDYKYHKIVQVLAYALMIQDNIGFDQAYAGIISFKNLNNGFLRFGVKSSPNSKRDQLINQQVLEHYTSQIKKLIIEICNPEIPIIEKEIEL
jgi:hypothetical protein